MVAFKSSFNNLIIVILTTEFLPGAAGTNVSSHPGNPIQRLFKEVTHKKSDTIVIRFYKYVWLQLSVWNSSQNFRTVITFSFHNLVSIICEEILRYRSNSLYGYLSDILKSTRNFLHLLCGNNSSRIHRRVGRIVFRETPTI